MSTIATGSVRPRVLVIDDDPLIGAALRRSLRNAAEVTFEPTALGALTRLDGGERFDLILCDVQMPGVLGPDFYHCVRRFVPDAASSVVLMSGGPLTSDALEGAYAPFLPKPLDDAALHALLRSRVARRGRS